MNVVDIIIEKNQQKKPSQYHCEDPAKNHEAAILFCENQFVNW